MFSTYDPARALEAIKTARGQCDYLVVYVHWGVERETEPKDYQRAMGRQYIDAGADLVIGSHPHVLQGIEYYKGKPIFYSLGNFVFGSSIPKTMLVQAEFSNDSLDLKLIPGTSSGGYTRTSFISIWRESPLGFLWEQTAPSARSPELCLVLGSAW